MTLSSESDAESRFQLSQPYRFSQLQSTVRATSEGKRLLCHAVLTIGFATLLS